MKTVYYCLADKAVRPERATTGSIGRDLHALREVHLHPNQVAVVSTGLWLASFDGISWQVRGRSGLATRGIWCHMGTIDRDYRGEIGVILTNLGNVSYRVAEGERIAQLVLDGDPFEPTGWIKVDRKKFEELANTERGSGGFGSTGR